MSVLTQDGGIRYTRNIQDLSIDLSNIGAHSNREWNGSSYDNPNGLDS